MEVTLLKYLYFVFLNTITSLDLEVGSYFAFHKMLWEIFFNTES